MTSTINLILALKENQQLFADKTEKGDVQTKAMLDLGWKLEDLGRLLNINQQLKADVNSLLDQPEDNRSDRNTRSQLSNFRKEMTSFIRNLSRHKRTPASHVFVMMVSSELRDVKPYAIPIQCIPYSSMNVPTLRGIINNVLKVMKARGMEVVGTLQCVLSARRVFLYNYNSLSLVLLLTLISGFTSNGEHNSIRNRGYTRPLTVLQIRSDIRTKYSRLSETALTEMLTPQGE